MCNDLLISMNNKTIIITGVSSGIGKACAELYLEKDYNVLGISRSNTIKNKNYRFISCDLSDPYQIEQLDFNEELDKESDIILINNAGTIGEIKHFTNVSASHLRELSNLNILAPQLLITLLFQQIDPKRIESIITISSGAAQRPIPSWAAYCASKAAINMYSETLKIELTELGLKTKIYSVAPGVVDTNMQVIIRAASQEDFTSVTNFQRMKDEGALRSPKEVAVLLDQLIQSEEQGEVVCRL
jgi:benzil reductase ((S)-benzoin forming)